MNLIFDTGATHTLIGIPQNEYDAILENTTPTLGIGGPIVAKKVYARIFIAHEIFSLHDHVTPAASGIYSVLGMDLIRFGTTCMINGRL